MKQEEYRQCSRCVMDTSDLNISFDENGYCNHCTNYINNISKYTYKGEQSDAIFKATIEKIKQAGKGKKYDCVIGVSGGVDSTYVAYLLKENGVRVLAVHMDNGWDTEESVRNVRTIIEKLGVDYESCVLDWEVFRRTQLAFLKASVPEVETPTDIAILAVLHKVASRYNVKYIISGGNFASEGILPKIWQYNAKDMRYFNHIINHFGNPKYKIPTFGFWKEVYYKFFRGIRIIYILNYVPYSKEKAIETLKKELGWREYGGKHHESRITSFVQSYLMPVKFNIDYRKATYSSMICEKQMTREEALELLKEKPYDDTTIKRDKEYLAKKFEITLDELETIINMPPKFYIDYPNNDKRLTRLYDLYRKLFPKKQ